MPLKLRPNEPDVRKSEPKEIKSILVATPSRVISRQDHLGGGEETEIAVQISVPQEGGWGWVVVAAAFFSICILDGIVFTYGGLMADVAKDFEIKDSLAALVNSIAVSMYYTSGPVVSAFINRFGFRACILAGSVVSSISLFISYFVPSFGSLCLFYGILAGFGYSLINMSSSLVVGFYFEKLRSIALAIATSGSSVGIMVLFPLNTYLVALAGWRATTLLHAGLASTIYFLGMAFRPLLSLTVRAEVDEIQAIRTVTYLPSVATVSSRGPSSRPKLGVETLQPTATERLFSAVSNLNYPTAASVVKEEGGEGGILQSLSPAGPSAAPAVSRLVISAREPEGGFSRRQLDQIKSIMSKSSVSERLEVLAATHIKKKKISCFQRLIKWEEHVPEERPLYRDDVFYDGNVERLPTYQKSVMGIPEENLTGLEYRLAVSRAATAKDLGERRGLCTIALRRVLATMLDPTLLRKKSFILMCCCGFLFFVGYLVPYVFIASRNEEEGIQRVHCNLFVSVIGFSNTVGRILLGYLAGKMNPLRLFQCSLMIAGIATMISSISFNLYFQYLYCLIFGFFIASIASLRSTVIVTLYGLDKLTSATGILLMFQGFGCLMSTPLAGMVKSAFGYPVAFVVAGSFMLMSGIVIMPVGNLVIKENEKAKAATFFNLNKNPSVETRKAVAIKPSSASFK